MELKPIRTEAEYNEALKEVSAFFDNQLEPGSKEGDRFEVLAMLVHAYEKEHFPIDPPDPIEAIKFRLEQMGMNLKDLEPMIGSSSRVWEVLNHKRMLSIGMIRKLHEGLGIPADVLIRTIDNKYTLAA